MLGGVNVPDEAGRCCSLMWKEAKRGVGHGGEGQGCRQRAAYLWYVWMKQKQAARRDFVCCEP